MTQLTYILPHRFMVDIICACRLLSHLMMAWRPESEYMCWSVWVFLLPKYIRFMSITQYWEWQTQSLLGMILIKLHLPLTVPLSKQVQQQEDVSGYCLGYLSKKTPWLSVTQKCLLQGHCTLIWYPVILLDSAVSFRFFVPNSQNLCCAQDYLIGDRLLTSRCWPACFSSIFLWDPWIQEVSFEILSFTVTEY